MGLISLALTRLSLFVRLWVDFADNFQGSYWVEPSGSGPDGAREGNSLGEWAQHRTVLARLCRRPGWMQHHVRLSRRLWR